MSLRRKATRIVFLLSLCILIAPGSKGQTRQADLNTLVSIPAVSGYEQELAGRIREDLKALSPKTDNLGNVYVTLGSGAPHRLLVAPMDEPGYVVSAITPDGYLRSVACASEPAEDESSGRDLH